MKAFILILCLTYCLTAPTVRTKDDLSCYEFDELKKDCGYYGINQQSCEEKGCCWKENPVQGVPWCFYGIDDIATYATKYSGKTCVLDRELREECGYKGINKQECEEKDCCWTIDEYESTVPWCFHGYDGDYEESHNHGIHFGD